MKFPRLFADLANTWKPQPLQYRLDDEQDQLKPEWRDLLEEFPDRFLAGTDLIPAADPSNPALGWTSSMVGEYMTHERYRLGQLTASTAQKIAVGKFGRSMRARPMRPSTAKAMPSSSDSVAKTVAARRARLTS